MKRILAPALLSVAAVVLVGVALTACGTSPSQTVDKMLSAYQDGDAEALAACYGGDDLKLGDDILQNMMNQPANDADAEGSSEKQAAAEETLTAAMRGFTYEIASESMEDNEHATVAVNIKAYDVATPFGEAFSNYFNAALTAAFSEAFGGGTTNEAQLVDTFYGDIADKVGARMEADPDQEHAVTLHLTKTDDGWKVDALDADALNALTGGLYQSLTQLSQLGEDEAQQ